ncbi:hypothetical protein B0A48_11037 [Cryoendolithus antarcticus]|uniref:Shugoshin C-terminal domain-containing protein n=1 Tax=Cryoendolithus antarcticus TaxID=1507870 RepID=A0A1V8SU95_9PEZI|nr:hypothetical protein B0A48_11037 [Cryoendolithus antarcticus]
MARLNEPPVVAAVAVAPPVGESVDARKSQRPALFIDKPTQDPSTAREMRTKSRQAAQKPATNFEEVKRRFIRQNRDLAKNNSEQNLRIRSLQLDVDRLLQTNLDLREEIIGLRKEVQDARKQSSRDGLQRFKDEMAAKMRQLSEMVEAMDDVPEEDTEIREEEQRRRRQSALQRMEFRERQPLAQVMREHQMPTISEHERKSRRSLGVDEIKAARLSDHSSNESPDLGPPPIARFECQDPIKFDTQGDVTSSKSQQSTESEELPANLSVNLETRRKRKDGHPRLEIRRHSIIPPPSPSKSDVEVVAPILRTGAKRKLADRDLEKPVKAPGKTEFLFSRKTTNDAATTTSQQSEEPTMEIPAPKLSPKISRRVLGDKSVNLSPRKVDVLAGKLEKDDGKKPAVSKLDLTKDRVPRTSRLSQVPLPPSVRPPTIATIEIAPAGATTTTETAPQSPAAPNIFSPTPSEPSMHANGSRDTPPPGDLSSLSNSTTASVIEGLRPSRRARGAVNYAEPSLTAKMRRPDKKMVDALTGLSDHRRVMSAPVNKRAGRVIEIKMEEEDEDAWKKLPESSAAVAPMEVPSPVLRSKQHVRSSSDSLVVDAQGIAATTSHLPKVNLPQLPNGDLKQPDELDEARKRLKDMEIFDFKDSSSPSSVASSGIGSTTRTSRRHSFIPKETQTMGDQSSSRLVREEETKPARATSRRRSMMV